MILFLLFISSTHAHTIRHYPDAPLEIITIGHPTLLLVADEVSMNEIDQDVFQDFIDDMIKTMKTSGGVGLAAPQVNLSKRLFVIKPSLFKKAEVMINPTIEYLEEKGMKSSSEGCLSIPGKSFKVDRYRQIKVNYQDRKGESHFERVKGFRAVVIQHEYDHLNGTLISDFFHGMFNDSAEDEYFAPRM